MRRALALLAVVLLSLVGCGGQPVGRDAFLAAERDAGWLPIGEFGRVWPATVEHSVTGDNELRFTTADGQPHHYRGFDGHQLKAVFLRSADGHETVVVLRSAERIEALLERDD